MIEDARRITSGHCLHADIIIVGAGAAGLAIALAMAHTDTRVLMLEGGGLAFDRTEQRLYRGANVGLRYEPLDLCRVKGLGGSTGRQGWAGWCKPLRPLDFEERHWVPLSGWPFPRETLTPHYRKAMRILGLPEEFEADKPLHTTIQPTLDLSGDCENEICPLSPAPHLGEVWRLRLEQADNVRVLLHANVREIISTPDARHVEGVEVATLNKTTFSARAPVVVLAAGGIENARLMLLSNRVQSEGLGNATDFVGRCFMDHPRFAWGQISNVPDRSVLFPYDPTNAATHNREGSSAGLNTPTIASSITISEAAQQREQILNARSWILPVAPAGEKDGGRELREIALWLMRHRLPADLPRRLRHVLADLPNATAALTAHLRSLAGRSTHWQFVTTLEPEPNPDSRVQLSDETDQLGMRRVKLDWRLGALTAKTLERTQELIVKELRRTGLHCSIIGKGGPEANQGIENPRWVWHHMGTTRMSADPATGVVDANCRVHGIDNLYIAGSSVFPTVGNDMPTVTLIALADRLAEHLKATLSPISTLRAPTSPQTNVTAV